MFRIAEEAFFPSNIFLSIKVMEFLIFTHTHLLSLDVVTDDNLAVFFR